MSGVAGVGMGKLKEMLREFEALSPEEAALAAKREQEARARILANGGSRLPPTGYQPPPMYFSMH